MPAKDIPHMTGLRALAAFMVLLLHLDQIHGNVLAHHFLLVKEGYLGVDIFFVLSGYILSHVYGEMFFQISVRTYGLFLWRRLARIYPVHIATFVALFVMVAARGLLNTNFWIISDIPRQLTLMQAWTNSLTWNVPAWSISAEWAAYCLFPIFAMIIFRPASLWLGLLFCIGVLVAFQLTYLRSHGLASAFMGWPAFQRILVEFTIGMLGYRLARSFQPSWTFDVISGLSFTAMLTIPVPLLKIIAVGVFVTAVAMSQTVVRALLSTNLMVTLGILSYSLYMIHFPVLKLVQNFNYHFGLETTSSVVSSIQTGLWATIMIVVAAVTFFLIERPARDWCRRQEGKLFTPPLKAG